MTYRLRPALSFALTALAAVALVAGCGSRGRTPNGGGDGDAGVSVVAGLSIAPADAVLAVDGNNAATLTYSVLKDGVDVTAQAVLTVDNTQLGAFAGSVFSSVPGAAGKTNVRAVVGSDSASTTLSLKVTSVVIAAGAPANAPTLFQGAADTSLAPTINYPADGVMIPPNLNELSVHFTPAAATDVFEIGFSGDAVDLRMYTSCTTLGSGCTYTPDETSWKFLSNAGRGQALTLSVRATASTGGGVGAATTQQVSFTNEDIAGGLYYWAAASGGIYRYDFGLRGQTAEPFYTASQAGAICVGCHALARSGKTIAVGINAPGLGQQVNILDVATKKVQFTYGGEFGGGSSFEGLTSDGATMVTGESGGLVIRKTGTGAVVGANPALANANMPDVSPDGSHVVFSRGSSGAGSLTTLVVQQGSLYVSPFTGISIGAPKLLVQSSGMEDNYYPSYSPDGNLILFNRSTSDSMDAADAKVMLIPATGNSAVIDLAAQNATFTGNSWPKWAPFIQTFGQKQIYWITYSSSRPYGLSTPGDKQIWMAAISVDSNSEFPTTDTSYPPFWLPFQDFTTGNHIAQWVEKIERMPCSQIDAAGCDDGEVCEAGVCVPMIN